MTQPISTANATTFAAEFAMLVINTDDSRSESDRLEREAARASYLQNAQHQVDALHAAADATATGAFVGAAFAIGSGALAIEAASSQYDADTARSAGDCASANASQCDANTLGAGSKLYGALGESGKAIIGDSASQNFQADAKRYETLAAQAQWQASDASSHIDKVEKQSDKALDTLQSIQRDQTAANNAIIGRI